MSTTVIEQNNATGKVTYWQANENQSTADRNGVSLADYIHAMYFYLRRAGSREVLMIGCGGGTLATMLSRAGVAVTMVDISAASFEIARRYFQLPADVECQVAEGRAFLARTRRRFDAIVLDAYDGSEIPRQFLAPGFFALAKARMARRGAILLMNVIVADDADRTPDRIARAMGESFRHVRLLDCDGWMDRNALVMAGAVAGAARPKLLLKPERCARQIARELKDLVFRARRD